MPEPLGGMEAIPAASWGVEKRVRQLVVPRVVIWEGSKPSQKVDGMGMKIGVEESACGAEDVVAAACFAAREMHIVAQLECVLVHVSDKWAGSSLLEIDGTSSLCLQ